MFGPLGFPELIFILILALLIFGPKRLPEIGRTIGRGMAEFRKASTELTRSINTELALDEPAEPPKPPTPPTSPILSPLRPVRTEPPVLTAARGTVTPESPELSESPEPAELTAEEQPANEPVEPS